MFEYAQTKDNVKQKDINVSPVKLYKMPGYPHEDTINTIIYYIIANKKTEMLHTTLQIDLNPL